MAGSNNFIQFDQNQTNIYNDASYQALKEISDGVGTGIADPMMHNKMYYQVTTMCAALGNVFSNLGYTVSDTDISALETVLSNIITTQGGSFTGALKQAPQATITSASGVLTLTSASNIFLANGNEAITSITGWTQGIAIIKWNTARTLTASSSLVLTNNGSNRTTAIGDIGMYQITSSVVTELMYMPVSGNAEVPVSIANGGTGATTAAAARTNLAVAKSGANSDITSLTGLTTALSIAQGGTGAITAILARLALGVPVTFGTFKNFVQTVTSNTAATITADYCPYNSASISCAISTAVSGAGGIDTGSVAASTWYYVYVIYNGSDIHAILSLSSSAPALPSGYTYYCRVGSIVTNSSGYLYRTIQNGRKTQYIVDGTILTGMVQLAKTSSSSGSLSTPTWISVSVSGAVPTTAESIIGSCFSPGGTTMIAPNNVYGAYSSTTNPPPVSVYTANNAQQFTFMLESTNIYYASGGATVISCMGWEDNL